MLARVARGTDPLSEGTCRWPAQALHLPLVGSTNLTRVSP